MRSREHLLHLLAEAAELEHNLLCSYLYTAFDLKQGIDEGLLDHGVAAVKRWHDAIRSICMKEMTHLAQVSNLMVAVGSRPHFDRPNLPVPRVITRPASRSRPPVPGQPALPSSGC